MITEIDAWAGKRKIHAQRPEKIARGFRRRGKMGGGAVQRRRGRGVRNMRGMPPGAKLCCEYEIMRGIPRCGAVAPLRGAGPRPTVSVQLLCARRAPRAAESARSETARQNTKQQPRGASSPACSPSPCAPRPLLAAATPAVRLFHALPPEFLGLSVLFSCFFLFCDGRCFCVFRPVVRGHPYFFDHA